MPWLHYVGFNAYQQCPNNGSSVLPKVISNWAKYPLQEGTEIQCTFGNLIMKTGKNVKIHGLIAESCDSNFKSVDLPFEPQSFVATDDFMIISKGSQLWKYIYDGQLSEIPVIFKVDDELTLWEDREIVKMSYMHYSQEIVLLLNDGSVWTLNGTTLSNVFNPSIEKATSISTGLEHLLIITESGCVLSFGNGSRGQLGHGDLNSTRKALQVLALGGLKMVKIAAGGWHSCAVSDSGDLYTWGWNNFGQMTSINDNCNMTEGDGLGLSALPMLVDNLSEEEVIDVACGMRHTVIQTGTNQFLSTGWNEYQQLGLQDWSVNNINKFKKINLSSEKNKIICGPWSTIIYGEESLDNEQHT